MRTVTKRIQKFGSIFAILLLGSGAGGLAVSTASAATVSPKLAPCAVKVAGQKTPKNTYKTETIGFKTITQNDDTLAKGQTQTVQTGHTGSRLITYTASYKKGKLIGCKHTGTQVTQQPQNTITKVGTYVYVAPAPAPTTTAPSCTNGTYVNVSGNTVCNPEADTGSGAPAGATAQCVDGSYSFSQHRSGTCSHHGGVASWL